MEGGKKVAVSILASLVSDMTTCYKKFENKN